MKNWIDVTREKLKVTKKRKEDLDVTRENSVIKALKKEGLDSSKFFSYLDGIKNLSTVSNVQHKAILEDLLNTNCTEIENKIIKSKDSLIIVLRLFKTIKFFDCIFTFPLDEAFRRATKYSFVSNREINGSKKFIRCCFKEEVFISGYQKDDSSSDTNILFDNDFFENCIFKKAVMVEGTQKLQESEEGPKLNRSALVERHEVQKLFIGCEFQKRLGLKSLILFCDLDSFMEGKRPNILDIDNCIFNAPFKLNKLKKIDKILIKDSEFNE